MHIGHEACNYPALRRVRNYLRRKPDTRKWGGVGDYLELVNPTAPPYGANWSQEIHPQEQKEWFEDFWKQAPPEFLIKGNHEERLWKRFGLDITKDMTKTLGSLHANYGGYFNVRVGEQDYTMFILHGAGRSKNPEYLLRVLVKDIGVDADIVALGHIHHLYHNKYDRAHSTRRRIIHTLRTGGFLGGDFFKDQPEYAIYMPLAQIGCPIIKLWPNKHKIMVDIDTRVP